MLLSTFAVVTTFGFATWLLGHFFEYSGVASIGAVLIIAAGATVALTTLEVKTGETVEKDYKTVNNETVVANKTVTNEYQTVGIISELGNAGPLSLGGLTMILGGVLMTQHLQEVSF